MTQYILDSNAILAYLKKERGQELISELSYKNMRGDIKCSMSTVNYGEVLYSIYRYYGQEKMDLVLKNFPTLGIELVDTGLEQILDAVNYKNTGGIAYCDCFVLALAKKYKATIITGDTEFKKFEKNFKIQWLE